MGKLIENNFYHIYNKSIAGYEIFNSEKDYERAMKAMRFFLYGNKLNRFCDFLDLKEVENKGFLNVLESRTKDKDPVVDIISYCLMPTHFHFVLKENEVDGISKFISDFSNSYTRYFNNKYNRKGTLWESSYKRVEVDSDEQLLHLTRYIHLNPTSANLVNEPEDWKWSSFKEYINDCSQISISNWKDLLDINPEEYKEFVRARKQHQAQLSIIKNKIIEDPHLNLKG